MFHHIFFDGWSVTLLLRELSEAYRALEEDRDVRWRPMTTDYQSFVSRQQQLLASEEGVALRQYWGERLGDRPSALDMPTDYPRKLGAGQAAIRGSHFSLELPQSTVRSIETLCHELEATHRLYCSRLGWCSCAAIPTLTISASVFPSWGDRVRIWSGSSAIFPTLPSFGADRSARRDYQLVRELQDEVFDVLAHGDYPFSTLVREIGARRRSSARDFYSVGFYFQSWLELERSASQGGGLWTEYLGEVTQEGECELVLDIHRFESTWRLFFKYDAALYKNSSIVRMAERYRGFLQQMVERRGLPLVRTFTDNSSGAGTDCR